MTIEELRPQDYTGKTFVSTYTSAGYYEIAAQNGEGFSISYRPFKSHKKLSFESAFFEQWLESPVAYGAFEKDCLLGFAEGFLEKWNNRYRISNICIFDEKNRRRGLGDTLIKQMVAQARLSGARMVVLETQSCNEKAIAFYKKHSFQIIGFDLYAYSNTDPERHEVRIEMGLAL